MKYRVSIKELKKEAKAVGMSLTEYTEILLNEQLDEEAPTMGDQLREISMLNVSFC